MNLDRYSRQTILDEIGSIGQSKLKKSRVLCVGIGGLGSPTSLYLAAAGVGTIGIIDPDRVDESNLQRQVLYKTNDVGTEKVIAAKNHLNELNPEIKIIEYFEDFNALNAVEILSQYDLVVDGTDHFDTKFLINDAAFKVNIPVIYGAINGFQGEVALFDGNNGACYRCFHPTLPKANIKNCAESGIIGSIAGVIGSLQATLCIQYIVSHQELNHPLKPIIGELNMIDLLGKWTFNQFKINKQSQCKTCSLQSSEVKLESNSIVCNVVPTIDMIRIQELIKDDSKNTLVIDVREQNEWEEWHLEQAIHWPLDQFEKGLFPQKLDQTKNVIVYCKSGTRSKKAVQILNHAGIKNALSAIPFLR